MNKIFIILFSFILSSDSSLETIENQSYDGDDSSIYFNMYKVCLANDDIGCAS